MFKHKKETYKEINKDDVFKMDDDFYTFKMPPEYYDKLHKYRNNKREMKSWTRTIIITVIVALCMRFFVFEVTRVDGDSMLSTLVNNQSVFVDKISYTFTSIKRNDIIICKYPNYNQLIVKRVIGMPGEMVEVKDGIIYINGNPDIDTHASEPIKKEMTPIVVPKDSYFVVGDNRNNSLDSRSNSIGAIHRKNIHGKARAILFPLSKMKIIK